MKYLVTMLKQLLMNLKRTQYFFPLKFFSITLFSKRYCKYLIYLYNLCVLQIKIMYQFFIIFIFFYRNIIMSSLNINSLYETMYERKFKKISKI